MSTGGLIKTKIFVGRVPATCKKSELENLFSAYGTVRECDILTDFAFVHMSTPEEAEAAIKALNNYELHGVRITVQPSISRQRNPMRGSGRPPADSWGRYNPNWGWNRTRPYPDAHYDGSYYGPPPPLPPQSSGYDYAEGAYSQYSSTSRAPPAAAAAPADTYGSYYSYDMEYGRREMDAYNYNPTNEYRTSMSRRFPTYEMDNAQGFGSYE